MTRVLSGAVLLLLAIAAVWLTSQSTFLGLACVLLLVSTRELVVLARASGVPVAGWPSMLAACITLVAWAGSEWLPVPQALLIVLLTQSVALGLVTLSRWSGGPDALSSAAAAFLPTLYLALPIGALVATRAERGPEALFLLMLTVMTSDTAQYYTGRIVGRTPLAPRISPKKTVEGALGGFLFGSFVLGVLGAWWLPDVSAAIRVLLGILVVAAGIAGDLFESMLKRSAGLKDSSSSIPGHGGVLDRIDALLFAAPVYFVALLFV